LKSNSGTPSRRDRPEGNAALRRAARRGGRSGRSGDLLIRIGKHPIGGVEDLMYVLQSSKLGETVRVHVLREGKELEVEATSRTRAGAERLPPVRRPSTRTRVAAA